MSIPSSPALPGTKTVDALALWEAEAQGNRTALSLIRVDGNERLLVPFTTSMARTEIHFVDASSARGYFHCNGPDCLLCRAGLTKDFRDLWPVYDLVDQSVGLIAITPNIRGGSLKPQLLTVLRQVKDSKERFLLSLRSDNGKFQLGVSPLPAGIEDGTARIEQFLEQQQAGAIDFGAVYTHFPNELLADIPEIATRLAVKGIKVA